MSNEQIEHSLDDILRDSVIWEESAQGLRKAADLAERLPVYEYQFSHLATKAGVREAYEEIRAELARLLGEGADAQQEISDNLYTTANIREADSEALDRFERAMVDVAESLDKTGDPAWLRATADIWKEEITPLLSGRAGWFTENMMSTENSWSGRAAEFYRDYLPSQKNAMAAAGDATGQLVTWLNELATAITAFWAGIAQAFFVGGVRLIAVLVSLLGVDTALNPGEAAAQIIRDLTTLINQTVEQFKDTSSHFKKVKAQMMEMNITQDAFPVLPGGDGERRWPQIRGGLGLNTEKNAWEPGRS